MFWHAAVFRYDRPTHSSGSLGGGAHADAVTVVLYTMMVALATMEHVSGSQYALGCAALLTVSFGGLAIGVVCGLLTALITRTTSDVRVVEPLAVFGMAYFSYLSAELFHFSGIIRYQLPGRRRGPVRPILGLTSRLWLHQVSCTRTYIN